MIYLWALLLTILNAVWLALILFGLPGTWLMAASTVVLAWVYWDEGMFHIGTLIAIGVLALLGEVMEFVASAVGTRKMGGSRWGAGGALLGSLIGGVVGTVFIPVPIIGTLLGACGGAAVGAITLELSTGQTMDLSLKSGVGAGAGRFMGTVLKLADGLAIWIVATVAAFWP